ncbi:SEC-C metal-binding domain-containing protein [Thermincola potens]|nr:SEC-C metal-binding domain-containing protein [Thermincola potens]
MEQIRYNQEKTMDSLEAENMFEEGFFLPEEDRGVEVILSEHPEIRILWERRAQLAGPIEINGVNPILHVMLEGIVENQLNDPEMPEVRETVERLEKAGLSRHAARAAIANVFIYHFFPVLKEKKTFDRQKYIRQLGLLGKDFKKTGRNEPCPCGSGVKFKKCCASAVKDWQISPMLGRLTLGQGSYILGVDFPDIDSPLHPLYQLENRVHIARFLANQGDVEGAAQALKENIILAETHNQESWLSNALYDMLDLCLNYPQMSEEGLATIERLLHLVRDDAKGYLLCDRADIVARTGRVEEADRMFQDIFETMPAWHFGRYRYALHLSDTGRNDQAITVLQDLVAKKGRIDTETYQAAVDVLNDLMTG